jgi:hypothetical protein
MAEQKIVTAVAFLEREIKPFDRLFSMLTDRRRCERAMALLLIGYAAVWSLYATISEDARDLHFDLGEMFV